jgi:hypothetical protein
MALTEQRTVPVPYYLSKQSAVPLHFQAVNSTVAFQSSELYTYDCISLNSEQFNSIKWAVSSRFNSMCLRTEQYKYSKITVTCAVNGEE